jgi:hypothetical protein
VPEWVDSAAAPRLFSKGEKSTSNTAQGNNVGPSGSATTRVGASAPHKFTIPDSPNNFVNGLDVSKVFHRVVKKQNFKTQEEFQVAFNTFRDKMAQHTPKGGQKYGDLELGDLNDDFGINASLDRNGTFTFEIIATNKSLAKSTGHEEFGVPVGNGSALFTKALTWFGDNVKRIEGHWFGDNPVIKSNFDAFKKNEGRLGDAAASETFTGKVVSDFGFTKFKVIKNTETYVQVLFTKP